MKFNGARIIVESLKKEKVDTIFAYTGGAVIPVFDEFFKNGKEIKIIQTRHEQAGTHAADGYARVTGKPGVVLVTSGPGATNTVTGIATAFMDSIPMVIITGQVSTSMIGTDAFQEVDTTGITQPITKANFLVTDIHELSTTIKKAFHIASTGRKGPVLIDIPVDIQKTETEYFYPDVINIESYKPKIHGHPKQIKKAMELLQESKKPLILSGGGVISSRSVKLVNEFSKRNNIPLVTTLQGHGTFPSEDLYIGSIGMHGTVYGNYAVQNSDLLIALGVRFSDRITGDRNTFCKKAKIIHVDIDPAEIDKNIEIDVPIVGDIRNVLNGFLKFKLSETNFSDWNNELSSKKSENPLCYEKTYEIKPQYLIELVNKYFNEDTIVIADVGQNQMWTALFYKFKKPNTFLTSGGLGTMGFALPAAIGAKFAKPEKEVVVIVGDGGFQMNIQELMTISQYKLKIKILVLDNSSLGMVRQWQQLFFGERYSGTLLEFNPSFKKIADAVGISAETLSDINKSEDLIKTFAEADEPMLIHAMIAKNEIVLPMVPAGGSIDKGISNT